MSVQTPPLCYVLVDDTSLTIGDTISQPERPDQMPVVINPRSTPLYDLFYEAREIDIPADLLSRDFATKLRLAVVTTEGQVTIHPDNEATSTASWRITAFEPYARVIGPQAARALELHATAQRDFADNINPAIVQAYEQQITTSLHRLESAAHAAEAALHTVHADGTFYFDANVGASGWELLAVVARDLADPAGRWTWEDYIVLTAPWRAAYGQHAHPDDIHLPAAVAQLAGS